MSNKQVIKKAGVALLALGFAFGGAGCDFIVADNVKDLNQTVATVNIAEVMENEANANTAVKQEIATLIQNNELSTNIPKRDLVSSFMGMGQTYIQSYGMSYAQTFTTLMDGLTNRKIMSQYAVAHYIANRPEGAMTFEAFKTAELQKADEEEKALLQKYPEVLTMKYYLTDYGKTDETSMKPYFEAVYNLQKSLNNSLDSAEQNYIKATEDEHDNEEARTLPTGVNTEKTDYLPMKDGKLDYDVYTGRNTLDSCGTYERIKGSSSSSRMSAYNSLLSNLQGYGLIKKNENTSVITKLEYYYQELSSSLSQALINKYYDALEAEAIADLEDNNYAYVTTKYGEILDSQKSAYTAKNGGETFKTALDKLSDTSFLLYGLQDYGFVYNILLPFSDLQSQAIEALKTKGLSQDEMFNARKGFLQDVKATDLRTTWFCADEAEHYAYEVTQDYYVAPSATAPSSAYLFFEDNMQNSAKYETLEHYLGKYPYQGTATFNADEDKYDFVKTEFDIDGFIAEMENYIDYAVGSDVTTSGAKKTAYEADSKTTQYTQDGVVDYSKFVYYDGQVTLTQTSAKDHFNPTTDAYKALSAVNELMFAFSTDTGCLNKYMGYVVAADKTDFVSEFEYAAQDVVQKGVGAYAVVPSDYGWHIIYCAYKYDGGEVYGDNNNGFIPADVEVEGTFSNLFYESLKAKATTTKATDKQTEVLRQYKDATKLYEKTYKDLMEIEG